MKTTAQCATIHNNRINVAALNDLECSYSVRVADSRGFSTQFSQFSTFVVSALYKLIQLKINTENIYNKILVIRIYDFGVGV